MNYSLLLLVFIIHICLCQGVYTNRTVRTECRAAVAAHTAHLECASVVFVCARARALRSDNNECARARACSTWMTTTARLVRPDAFNSTSENGIEIYICVFCCIV